MSARTSGGQTADPYAAALFAQMQQNFQLQGELNSLRRAVDELRYQRLSAELDELRGMVYARRPARGGRRK